MIVKFKEPQTESEVHERFNVVWIDHPRMMVQLICDFNIRPTNVYNCEDMVEAHD